MLNPVWEINSAKYARDLKKNVEPSLTTSLKSVPLFGNNVNHVELRNVQLGDRAPILLDYFI
jgi:hypothetical protein